MIAIDDELRVEDARQQYFRHNGFGDDGGYGARWVALVKGPIPIGFPNLASRVRAVRCHDIHHLVTGYSTHWLGEGEISTWELASGCRDYFAAWVLNLGGMMIGLLISPRATFRAFVRGRHSANLYHRAQGIDDELLDMPVRQLRAELGLASDPAVPTAMDVSMFVGCVLVVLAWNFTLPTLIAIWALR